MNKGVSYLLAISGCIFVLLVFSVLKTVANENGIIIHLIMYVSCFFVWRFFVGLSKSKTQSNEIPKENNTSEEITKQKYEIDSLVVNNNSGKQMRVKIYESTTGKYSCYSNNGLIFEGNFEELEIKLFK